MTPKELKNDKEYKFPGKKITWSISNLSLILEVEIDWVKYLACGVSLPPEEIGRCTNWHFKLSDNGTTSMFVSSWDIRRVKDKLKLIDSINEKIMIYAMED